MTILKYLFAAAVLLYLWRSGYLELALIKEVLKPDTLAALFVVLFFALVFNFLRFYFVVNSQGLKMTLMQGWKVFWMGLFFNFLMPGGTGGDLIKGFYLLKGREDRKAALFGAIVYDRFIGMYVMLAMALVAMLLRPQELISQTDLRVLFTAVAVIFIGLSVFTLVMMIERARNHRGRSALLRRILIWDWQKKSHDLLINLFQVRLFLLSMVLTLACQLLIVWFLLIASEAAGGGVTDKLVYFIVAPIGFMIMAVPIAPGGLGVGQAAFNVLFKIYTGISSPVMVTAITVYQIVMLSQGFLGLYYYLRWDSSTSRFTTPASG